jgi:riboflavin kinase/FMN adenylyltransferase
VGENFRFGHRASGDVALLRQLGPTHGFTVAAVPLIGDQLGGLGERWSSTAIRALLADGDVVGAAAALGRLHRVEGPVVHGDHRGRELGYPTANLAPDDHSAIPRDGVYAGWLLRASGDRLPAAISIGTNPTFGGTARRVEAYVLDRDDLELYDEHVALDFLERLRDTVRFDGIEPLVAQMALDVGRARDLTA